MDSGESVYLVGGIEGGEIVRATEVVKLAEGLNYGEGSISVEDRIDSPEDPVNPELLSKVETAINSDEILVDIDVDDDGQMLEDDGCGDGRGVKTIFRRDHNKVVEMKRSLNRAKIFGGGLTAVASAEVGLGRTKGDLNGVFSTALSKLKTLNIKYGAHTDEHAHGENCGCGAIDKAPQIISNAVKYEEQIRGAIDLLTEKTDGLDEVFGNFSAYADEIEDQPYSGRKVMDSIENDGRVVKELEGPHLEVAIVINTVKDKTVDQDYIRKLTDGLAQVFAVDVPRLQEIAERAYDGPDEQRQAFLSMLVYTLATAGTLTKGDLPVFVVNGKQLALAA